MERAAFPPGLAPDGSPSQRRLWEAHRNRLPNPEAAFTLVERWMEAAGPPSGDADFVSLLYLAGTSEALFLSLLRHPGQLPTVSKQAASPEGLGRERMEEALARFLLQERWPSHAAALAAFRSVQTARILLQDVLGVLPFELVARELSILADALIRKSFALTYQPLRERLGLPLAITEEGRPSPCGMAVFALGKLGGLELNYSSDADLIAFYGSEGKTDRGRPNGTFFDAWFREAVALLTTVTPDGPCLRVDVALRPRGRDGELTLPAEAALAYYREWADLWERQAWIKGRVCAGDEELGARFLLQMEGVVFREYSWAGIAKQVRRARERTLARLGDAGAEDLKEGPGGIRDAEFAVQALQLAHGPSDRWVREPNTLLALSKMAQKGRVSTSRQATFAQAYTLLRRAEHWIQVQHMRQAHRLRAEESAREPLARFLGFTDPADCSEALRLGRVALRGLFLRTMEELESRDSEPGGGVAFMLTQEGMLSVLQRGRFHDPARALPLLSGLYGVLTPHLTTPQRKEHLVRIHFSLRREFERADDPYRGLSALHRIVQALAGEPDAVEAVLDRPRLARILLRLARQSEALTDAFIRMPSLAGLLSYEAMRAIETRLQAPPGVEEGPDALRRWQKEVTVIGQAREIIQGESLAWSQALHSEVADRVCAAVFQAACSSVEAREGLERGRLSGALALVALGRLGFREMHPRSDLDLVFLKRGAWSLPEDPDRSARAETQVVREMAGALAAVTRHGALYETDLRLRPYGASGLPVQSLDGLLSYFSGPARLWERLSYLKGRFVAGNRALCDEALGQTWALSLRRGAPREELEDLADLRKRLEHGSPHFEGALKFRRGGLLHQDLLMFVLQVRSGLVPEAPGGSLDLLDRLERQGVLAPEERGLLFRARAFMEGALHRSRLRFARPPAHGWPAHLLADLDGRWPPPARSVRQPEAGAPERLWKELAEGVAELWERRVVSV